MTDFAEKPIHEVETKFYLDDDRTPTVGGGQASLFGLPYGSEEERSLTDRFLEWKATNAGAEVINQFTILALHAKKKGLKTYGAKAIWERLRWYYSVEAEHPDGEEYKLNNNYTSRVARVVEALEPRLSGFFEKRRLRSEA